MPDAAPAFPSHFFADCLMRSAKNKNRKKSPKHRGVQALCLSDDRMDETAALFSDAAAGPLPGRSRQAFAEALPSDLCRSTAVRPLRKRSRQAFAEASLSACPDRVRETVFSA